MSKANRKTTTKARRSASRVKPSDFARIVGEQVDRDPIFRAIEAYDRAHGAVLVMGPDIDGPKARKTWHALHKAEMQCAEAVPTSIRGLNASARWYREFVASHDGIENLTDHPVIEAWPQTIRAALKGLWRDTDPINEAIRDRTFAWQRFNEGDEKVDKAAYDKASDEWNAAENRMMATAPTTPHGIAAALEVMIADPALYELQEDVLGFLTVLAAAARALA